MSSCPQTRPHTAMAGSSRPARGMVAATLALALLSGTGAARGGEPCEPDATRSGDTRDTYHGTTVADPYRWLEDWSDPAVRAWSDAQSACARAHLDALTDAPVIRARLTELLGSARGTTYGSLRAAGGRWFALRSTAQAQQPALVELTRVDASTEARVVLDLMQLDPSGSTSIDWHVPSPDGRLVAVSLSSSGSERGRLHVFESANGKPHGDTPIENVNNATAGGDLAWAVDGRGFFYTRYPQPGTRPESELAFHQRVYFHALGTPPSKDRHELGAELPAIAAIRLRSHPSSGRLIAWVQNGDSGQFRFFLREPDGRWRAFGDFGQGHIEAAFGSGDDLYVATAQDAPRGRIVRISAADLDFERARTVIPESDAALTHSFYNPHSPTVSFHRETLMLVYQAGGPTVLRLFTPEGKPRAPPALEDNSYVSSLTALGRDEIAFAEESFVTPRHWRAFNLRTRSSTSILSNPAGAKPWLDVSVDRELATSPDGTRVPVTILKLRGAATRGLLLTGYGGYRISITPHFAREVRVLLEQGVAYAVANLRGGGEFGEEWHRQGSLTLKQNVFDDFIAVAGHLVDRGHVPRGKLAITGTSNGGLLMGAVLTQRPELAQAVVSRVGVYDSLRNELDANGVFNIPEFGTVGDEQQFRALLAYSPYHNVAKARYPALLLLTGENDSRVNPMHSRKMLARLQAANLAGTPLLLRTSASTGHGAGTPLSARIEELTDEYAFIMNALSIPYEATTADQDTKSAASLSER